MTAFAEPLTLETALGLIGELRTQVEALRAQVQDLRSKAEEQANVIRQQAAIHLQQAATNTYQAKRIAELEEKVGKDSSNSSKPPSSDRPRKTKDPAKERSGRPRGGQPGHKKHERQLLPIEQARSVMEVKPPTCTRCGQALEGEDPCPRRHQLVDLPPIEPILDEWRLHTLVCDGCQHRTEALLRKG